MAVLWYFILLLVYFNGLSAKLNVPRVLLPLFDGFSTNFTLEVTDYGCYVWRTTRPDIIDLVPIDFNEEFQCSIKVIVSVSKKSKIMVRNTAIILAEEIHSEQVLYCDVIVDVIDSLQIVTTTRELFIEEAPEAFEVRAYDIQGNEFSTLNGVEFQWSIVNIETEKMSERDSGLVLRFIKFSDSPYETPPSIIDFEKRNIQGHIILLEGVKTGSTKISVKLPHIEYSNVNATEVNLMVVANLILDPSNVVILRGDAVKYKIYHVHQGRLEEIHFPSSQYYLEVENKSIVKVIDDSGYLSGLNEGKTRVLLHDRNANSDIESSTKIPSAIITVAKPFRISLSLLPHFNWAVIIGETHELIAEIYTKKNEKFYIGPEVGIKINVENTKFVLNSCSANGSWCDGFGNELGKSRVQASLENVFSKHLIKPLLIEPHLTTSENIRIYAKLDVVPNFVVLPWDNLVKTRHEMLLKVSGGDGKFLWSSNNTNVGTVTQAGLVRVLDQGTFQVTVSMLSNVKNKALTIFHVRPVISLRVLDYNIETAVNSMILVKIGLFTEDGSNNRIPFTYCHEIPFKLHFSDNFFVHNSTVAPIEKDESCAVIRILPLNSGTCKFTVSYIRNDGIMIDESLTLTAYKPLTLIEPQQKYTVLAVKTSRNLIFNGGPKFWSTSAKDYSRKINYTYKDNENVVETAIISDIHKYDFHVVQVFCKQLGDVKIELVIENSYSKSKNVYEVFVSCTNPASFGLLPSFGIELLSCPLNLRDMSVTEILAKSDEVLKIEVFVKDDLGRKFDNFSSLNFDWSIQFDGHDRILSLVNKGQLSHEYRMFEDFRLPGKTLLQLLTYKKNGKAQLSGNLKNNEKSLSNRVNIHLINSLELMPKTISLFSHASNLLRIQLRNGSNYFKIETYPDEIALVQYIKSERILEIRPLHTGQLIIKVNDLCLSPQIDVTAEVNMVSIDRVELFGSHFVQLDNMVNIIGKFFDKNNDVIIIPNLEAIKMKMIADNDIVSVRVAQNIEFGLNHFVLEVKGIQLGESKLMIQVQQNIETISSIPFSIQVFRPLRLMPKTITLLIGSSYQIWTQGGPQIDTTVSYSTDQFGVINISDTGLINGLELGTTRITAEISAVDEQTGKQIVYSSDYSIVEVIALKGIRIATPIKRIIKGSVMPIWTVGIPEQINPMILSSVYPEISFNWQVTDHDVLEMFGVFDTFGIRYDPVDTVSARIKARNVGRSIVKLTVIVNERVTGVENGGSNVTYQTYTELEVFENLELIRPSAMPYHEILMTPWTEMRLETNKDQLSVLTYKVQNLHMQSSSNNHSLDLLQVAQILTVSNEGVLKSYSVMGKCSLLITSLDLNSGLTENLLVLVEVKPIFYLVTRSLRSWSVGSNNLVKHVPIGTEIQFEVDYYDNIGRQFVSANLQPHIQLNRVDIVTMKSTLNNFIAFSQHSGKTVFKVSTVDDSQTSKAIDYVLIHTEQIIKPYLQKVIFGDVLCFWTNLLNKDFKKGEWITSDKKLLNLDPNSGIGQVIGMHSDSVTLQYSLTPLSNIHLEILPITKIEFLSTIKNITNYGNQLVNVPVIISNNNLIRKTNFLKGYACDEQTKNITLQSPFLCHLAFLQSNHQMDISYIFRTRPKFDPILGYHVCEIVTKSNNTMNISTIDDTLVLQVFYGSEIETSIKIGFNPAIYFHSTDLVINEDTFTTKLLVTGLPWIMDKFTLTPVDDRILGVNKPEKLLNYVYEYKITLKRFELKQYDRNSWLESLKLIAESKLTNQKIMINVRTKTSTEEILQPKCFAGSYGSPLLDIISSSLPSSFEIIVITFITMAIYVMQNYLKPTINVNVSTNDSVFSSPEASRTYNRSKTSHFSARDYSRTSSNNRSTLIYGDNSLLDQ